MKLQISLILLIFSSCIHSQSQLDTIKQFNYKKHFEIILNESKNENSKYSFSQQLEKFNNDETQSDFEVLCMLIGFTDNENFKPYLDILTVDKEIYELNEKEKYTEAIEYGNLVLSKNPFMIKVLRELSYAYLKTGNKEMSDKCLLRTGKIYNAMFSSSSTTGVNIKEPIFSLGPKDGQYYIKYFMKCKLGKMGSGYDKNGYFIDMLDTTVENIPVTFYFNINHVTKTMMKK